MVLSLRRHRVSQGLAVAGAIAVFLGCWEMLHHWFYAHHQLVDTPTYEGYGRAMRHGIVPYRDIPVEYPPAALPVFVAPTYLGGYDTTFGWLMAACGSVCIVFAAAAGARVRSLAMIAVSPLLIGSLALTRFDFWPELFVVASLAALLHDRHRLGWTALGAAIAAKLYGFVLIPLAIAWTVRRRGMRELSWSIACAAAVVAIAVVPFAIIAPDGLWRSFTGQTSRPLQIESLAASFLTTFGHPTVEATHGSLNLAGQGTVATLTTVLELAVLVVLWLFFARGPATGDRLVRYSAACLCAFIALGKVLSPQFLVWLVPIVPLVRGIRGGVCAVLLAAALVLTDVFFPARYWEYIFHFHLAWVVLLRNLVLVGLLVALTWPVRERARSS